MINLQTSYNGTCICWNRVLLLLCAQFLMLLPKSSLNSLCARTNASFATGGPDMKLFKFPMGDNSKWKSCLLQKCLFLIVIILRSIIKAFFVREGWFP